MILNRFNPLIALFDAFEHLWEASLSQRRLAGIFFWVYLLALALIQARRAGLMPSALAAITPSSHFAAIQLAFTLILAVEVIELIMSIPSSFSRSVGKQFEILALILLRDAFKQLSHLPQPVDISTNLTPLFHIACSAAGALVVFIALGFYFKIVRRISYSSTAPRENQAGYIIRKKLLALVLLGIFAGTGLVDLFQQAVYGTEHHFFETIYTVLIFADIALVLLSQQFMPSFHAVFRNSGFVVGTLLMRLSFSTSHPWNAVVSVVSAAYVLGLTWAVNYFPPDKMDTKRSEKNENVPQAGKEEKDGGQPR